MSDTELLPSQSSQVWGQHQTSKQTDALRPGECPDAAVLGTMRARAETTAPDRCFPPFPSCVPCDAFTVCFLNGFTKKMWTHSIFYFLGTLQ